ncbi:putative membrane protein [Burkholderia cenocepacia]|uniref:Membrane protein n=1 Tax=Burkholderia cenocepacia TaxID=95486 RepID=A0AAN0VP21_9BURK|nr:putative membrane protein [Burkholderia cenocepacia]
MDDRRLSAWRIASLLVSTSCGIGFLLGTGELALRQGMAASMYAVATSIGLLTLAFAAPRLWETGQSIWTYFDTIYGPVVGRQVAALSLIWMAGVLGAQIRGASALLALSGVPRTTSIIAVDCLAFSLSFVRLSALSSIFAICLGGCNAILVYALVKMHHLTVWLRAPESFVQSMTLSPIGHAGLTLISVVALVIFGADYQQFPLRARTPSEARRGCLLAAVVVFVVGFLPASTVIASARVWDLSALPDPAQVVPVELTLALGNTRGITQGLVVSILLMTAVGAACSILRAMSDAIAISRPSGSRRTALGRILPVLAATLVTASGRSIIDMMITLNVIYLAAAGPLLTLALLGCHIPYQAAKRSMLTGFSIATACYVICETNMAGLHESLTLVLAWPCALLEALRSGITSANQSHTTVGHAVHSILVRVVTRLTRCRLSAEPDRPIE